MPPIDQPATKLVKIGEEWWELAVNQRALYALELATSEPYDAAVDAYLKSPAQLHRYLLLWGFSASYRARTFKEYASSLDEIRAGALVPGTFIEALPFPGSDGWGLIVSALDKLLLDSGLVVIREKPDSDPPLPVAPASDDAPTGGSDSTSPESSSG